ncbi:MAG: uridine kinase [Pyrinomonadaceae bacterium]
MKLESTDYLCSRIIGVKRQHPVRVAIDGPDAAGKTTLAHEIAASLLTSNRPVILASIDGFHNPARIRHERGATSPEGYYYDSFNYPALAESLLLPLGPDGSRRYSSSVFDFRIDAESQTSPKLAEPNAILLFDGVFLLREELRKYWDFTIFVHATFQTILLRAERRDKHLFGSIEEVRKRYEQRYIPGQNLYFAECLPKECAQVVIDNNDPRNPLVL